MNHRRPTPDARMVTEIAHGYGLTAIRGWDDLGGSQTTNLRLRLDHQELVARVHQTSTTRERLAAIQSARRVAGEAGLPTPPTRPAADGSTMIILGGGHLVEVEPYVQWSQRMNTAPLLRTGFGTLGRLHDALRQAELPPAADVAVSANHLHAEESTARSSLGVERIRGWRDAELTRFAERAHRHVEQVTTAEVELADGQVRQVVHGDFWDNNVLFHDGGLVAVIDYDFIGRRARVDDLALTIYFWLLEPGRGLPDDHDRRLVADLVAEYDANTSLPLSAAERMALPLAIARQPAWSLGRWIPLLDEADARSHAVDAMSEFGVAAQVLTDLELWQEQLEFDTAA